VPNNSALNIRVNTQQLTGLEKLLRKVFDRKTPREFNSEIGSVNRQLDVSRRAMGAIVKQMDGVARGTAQFKKLKDQLKDVNSEISTLDNSLRRLSGGGGGGSRGGGSRGGGGFGGGRAPQIPSPSMGGLATALGAIPVAGALAAGGLMTAAQAYGSHLSWQQAQMQAAPYLMSSAMGFRGPTGGGGGNPFGARSVGGNFTNSQERMMELYGNLPDDIGGQMKAVQMRAKSRSARIGMIASAYEGVRALFTSPLTVAGKRQVADSLSNSPQMDAELGAIAGGAGNYKPGSDLFDRWGYADAGRSFGLTPQQALAQASGLSQAAGRPVGVGEFGVSLAMTQRYGVSGQQQGEFMLGSRWTGNTGDAQEVADQIGIAVTHGLEGSEIATYLQQQSSWLHGMYEQGNNVSLPGLLSGAAALNASGVDDPFRFMSYSRSFGAGAAAVGRNGPQSGADLRMMRAMGFTGQGGFGEYAKIRLKMQDAGASAAAMPEYLKSFLVPGMDEYSQGLIIQQAMGALKANITAEDAIKLGKGIKSGTFGHADIQEMVIQGQGLARATGYSVIANAGIEQERIGVGGQVAPAVQALERASLNIAKTITGTLGQAINDFAYAIEDATGRISSTLNLGTSLR